MSGMTHRVRSATSQPPNIAIGATIEDATAQDRTAGNAVHRPVVTRAILTSTSSIHTGHSSYSGTHSSYRPKATKPSDS
jgi:hypothetical protein